MSIPDPDDRNLSIPKQHRDPWGLDWGIPHSPKQEPGKNVGTSFTKGVARVDSMFVSREVDTIVYDPSDGYNVKDFGATGDGTTDDAEAIQAAIDAAYSGGGGQVLFPVPSSAYLVNTALVLKSNVQLLGMGYASRIRTTASVSTIHDNDSAVTDVRVNGLRISAASGQYAIFLNSTTSARVMVDHCHFDSGKRAISVDGATDVTIAENTFTALTENTLQIGSSEPAALTTKRVTIRGNHASASSTVDGSVYAVWSVDGVAISSNTADGCGITVGTSTHYHSIYVRASEDVAIASNTSRGQRGGAAIHVHAEGNKSQEVAISENICTGSTDYVGIRCNHVDGLSVVGNAVAENDSVGVFVSNSSGVVVGDNTLRDNNAGGGSGTEVGSAIRLQSCNTCTVSGNVSTDAETTGHGQGNFLRLEISTEVSVTGNTHKVDSGLTGYYMVDIVNADSNNIVVSGNLMYAASALVNTLATTPTVMSVTGNICYSNSNTALIRTSTDPYHKYIIRDNINQSVPFRTESDGTNMVTWSAAAPSSGIHAVGDIAYDTAPSAGGNIGWVCTTAGTPGTWEGFGDTTINVKAYGATGDATAGSMATGTDDSSAIQAAITAASTSGGTVLFPPGAYRVDSAMTAIATSGVHIVGNSATINWTSTVSSASLFSFEKVSAASGTLSGAMTRGDNVIATALTIPVGSIVSILNGDSFYDDGFRDNKMGELLIPEEAQPAYLAVPAIFSYASGHAISVITPNVKSSVSGLRIIGSGTDNGTVAVKASGCVDFSVSGCSIEHVNVGVQFWETVRTTVSNNWFYSIDKTASGYSVSVSQNNYGTLIANNVADKVRHFVTTVGENGVSRATLISGNNVSRSKSAAIDTHAQGYDTTISGNHISDSLKGIQVRSPRTTVIGNVLHNCHMYPYPSEYSGEGTKTSQHCIYTTELGYVNLVISGNVITMDDVIANNIGSTTLYGSGISVTGTDNDVTDVFTPEYIRILDNSIGKVGNVGGCSVNVTESVTEVQICDNVIERAPYDAIHVEAPTGDPHGTVVVSGNILDGSDRDSFYAIEIIEAVNVWITGNTNEQAASLNRVISLNTVTDAYLENNSGMGGMEPTIASVTTLHDFDAPSVINVKAYGAIGDGTTDDSPAIQAAIDSLPTNGGTVLVPGSASSYGMSSTIEMRPRVSLVGVGTGVKLIALDGWTTADPMIRYPLLESEEIIHQSWVRNLGINCNKLANVGVHALNWQEPGGMDNVVISGAIKYGLHLEGRTVDRIDAQIMHCYFSNLWVIPLVGTGWQDADWRGIYAESTVGTISFENVTITGDPAPDPNTGQCIEIDSSSPGYVSLKRIHGEDADNVILCTNGRIDIDTVTGMSSIDGYPVEIAAGFEGGVEARNVFGADTPGGRVFSDLARVPPYTTGTSNYSHSDRTDRYIANSGDDGHIITMPPGSTKNAGRYEDSTGAKVVKLDPVGSLMSISATTPQVEAIRTTVGSVVKTAMGSYLSVSTPVGFIEASDNASSSRELRLNPIYGGITLTGGHLYPLTTEALNLGSAVSEWAKLFVGSVIKGVITLAAADGTPPVDGASLCLTADTTTLTGFTGGVVGQTITIKANHTMQITDAGNTQLAGNFSMTSGDTITLTMFETDVWSEVSRSNND